MKTLKYQRQYRRRLPHIQPPGATFSITFRLADSIPKKVWKELRVRLALVYAEMAEEEGHSVSSAEEREQQWFQEFDDYLHNTTEGPF